MSKPIKSVEEFIEWTKQLDGQMLLYRGLAKGNWAVKSSAYHRIELSQEKPLPETFQNYIKQLLDNAGLQGFRYRHGRRLSDLDLLAELQHNGAATCLIDFTENALIALWFACREEPKGDGKVVAMATGGTEKFSTINYEHLSKPITEFLNKDKLWKWTPSSMNNRIVAQQSVFVFGEGIIEENLYDKIEIDSGSKKDIIETLEKSFGVKEQHLFNDLAGFALFNAYNKPYGDYSAEDYFLWGLKFHQQGEYENAKDYFDKTLELDPQSAGAYNNRGYAKFVLGDHKGAISDYDKAIELEPQYAMVYCNRGNAKLALGYYKDAISNSAKTLELNPQYPEAYNIRGVAKNKLGECQDAISDFNKAIELDPRYTEAYNNRGDAKSDSGDHQGAILDYDKAIEQNPQYAKAYRNRGDARNASGDQAGAKKDWERAKEIDPNLPMPGS